MSFNNFLLKVLPLLTLYRFVYVKYEVEIEFS